MEEEKMAINIIALAIGAAIFGAGLYYRVKEKHDRESRKVYGIITAIGALILVGFIVKTILDLV